jgi:hypothetical protein
MSRLKKTASNELELIFEDVKTAFRNMQKRTGEWAIRDIVTRLTSFGFYEGQVMVSVDPDGAKLILEQMIMDVENIKDDEESLYEIYDVVYNFV